ncbi:MAG TPA: lamin tail domain-containing protein [Ilumatobacter sp.]|nr:lamin tail domain-containing protein [Ilumatobacter sp.]
MKRALLLAAGALGASAGLTFAVVDIGGSAGASTGPDVIVSEVMINPHDVYDSRGEWIEVLNRGDATAQLGGWRLSDGRTENVALPDLSVAPGERVVFARYADAYVNGGVEADWVYGNRIVLDNVSDRLVLRDAHGVEHDHVDWYPGSGLTAPDGRSLALRDESLSTGDPLNWCAATTVMGRGDLGSPGAPNECDAPAEMLVITEVMQNPRQTSDYSGEWFELHNPGPAPIDIAGWTIKDDDRDRFVVPSSVVVPAGGYAVLGNSSVANGNVALDFAYGGSMQLQNDWDELAIADAHGILVDRLAWDNGRTFPDPDGASMSLIDPNAENADGAAWCTATSSWAAGDRGTPHAASWCVAPGTSPIVVTEVMFDPETPRSERASEWFEVANLGTDAIDMSGWTITAGDYKVHTIGSLVVAPGSLAVLAASGDPAANGGITATYVYGTSPEVPLYNASGRVILKNRTGTVIDRVEWSAGRGFPIPAGASITLAYPTANNELGPNWCVATARWGAGDFGSPGTADTCEAPPAAPSVEISEVMRNPAVVSDSEGEWFELHNTSAGDVDLRGWSLSDGASDHHVISRSMIVPAGGYVVLGRTSRNPQNGGVTTAYAYGDGFVLSNNDDRIAVRDQYDQLVDEVVWAKADGSPRPNGASMARTADGWCISGPQFGLGDLGTPAAPNDCTPLPHPDVVVSEIHLDPAAVSDTTGEWIEITNNSTQTVDLAGWVLRDDDADSHWIRPEGSLLVAPGRSVVLGRDLARDVNGDTPVGYSYNAAFPLADAEDEITLLDNHLVWIDRVTWTASRPLPASVGVSASVRDLAADNSDPANWCASVTTYGSLGERGTPGMANACEPVATGQPPTTTTTTTTTEPASTTTTTTTTPATTTTSTTTTTTTTTQPPTTTSTTTSTTTTTTTTAPPPPAVPPLSAGYGLLATAGAGCASGLTLTGSGIRIEGGVRSNTSVTVQASDIAVNGPISYATTKNVGSSVVAPSIVQEPAPVAGTVFTVADFALGGVFSTRPGYVGHIGDWTVDGIGAAPGIHFVTGNVVIADSAPDLVGVTIVATGTVTIAGGSVLSPAAPDLPTVLAFGGTCKKAAISLAGGSVTWSGVLAAPNGLAQINANTLRGGSVIAAAIQMSASDLVIS